MSLFNKPISRRQAIKTVGISSALAVGASMLSGCGKKGDNASDQQAVQVDEKSCTDILESYKEAPFALTSAGTWDAPLGSVFQDSQGSWLAAISVGNVASHMTKACAFSLQSGKMVDVVTECTAQGPNWVIYDARCSDDVYAWVELDMLSHACKLYGAEFSAGALKNAMCLWDSSADYDPPSFGCAGKKVLWQVMPYAKGKKKKEKSVCYLWEVGQSEAKPVVETSGRFATPLSISKDVVTLTPYQSGEKSNHYAITAYSLGDNLKTVVDTVVLPAPIKPMLATRIGDAFAFSIEANYDSGGLLGHMGTYIGTKNGPYTYLSREPFASVSGNGSGTYIIKNRASYFVVNTNDKTYSVLTAEDRCLAYGEYPACSGTVSTFSTFSTVKDEKTGNPSKVVVRAFKI